MFTEPVRLAHWAPPGCGGIAAVLVHDPKWAPRPFRAVHFAEFGNDSKRDLPAPAGAETLYVSVLPMPFSTTAQRRAVRDELIGAYNPTGLADKPRRPIGFTPQPVPVTAIES
jgi:hypothetical protein